MLTTEEADGLFFPGPGSKVNKARTFCSNCPVQDTCLVDAIETGASGFISGTTEDERKVMRELRGMALRGLGLPEEPSGKRRIFRKVFTSTDPHQWLDEIEPTAQEICALDIPTPRISGEINLKLSS